MKTIFILFLVLAMGMTLVLPCSAQKYTSSDILKAGLLGAGTGAAASAVGGGNAGTGALVGAGVNVVGGALLDMLTEADAPQQPVYQQQPDYRQPVYRQPVYQQQPAYQQQSSYSDGYEAGFANGYKKGYTEGYKDGLDESGN